MQRRKYLAAMGSMAAGGAAMVGTGAFTSATIPDRQLSVSVDGDAASTVALNPGDDDDVFINSDNQLALDLSGANDEGVNINSRYEWGDWAEPDGDPAFTIQNNDEHDYMFKMEYYFDDPSWITTGNPGTGNDQSFVEFKVAAPGGGYASRTYPDQRGSFNKDHSLPNAEGSGFGNNSGGFRFNAGEEYTMAVAVDTTGPLADVDDKPSGTLHITVAEQTSSSSWDPQSPPS
jgi:hypothetical protein